MTPINSNGGWGGTKAFPIFQAANAPLMLIKGIFLPSVDHLAPCIVQVHEKFLAARMCIQKQMDIVHFSNFSLLKNHLVSCQKQRFLGPIFRKSIIVHLGQGPGTFSFSTNSMFTMTWSLGKVIASLLTFDYSFDQKTTNVSISLFSRLNVIKYVKYPPQCNDCAFLLPPIPLTKR